MDFRLVKVVVVVVAVAVGEGFVFADGGASLAREAWIEGRDDFALDDS